MQEGEEEGDTPNLQPRGSSEGAAEAEAEGTPAFAFQPGPTAAAPEPSPEILGYSEQLEELGSASAEGSHGAQEPAAVIMPR